MARVSAISTVRLRAFPGDHVRRDEVVAVLKSPDFLTAESELISVLNNRGGRLTPHDSLLALARSKLVYMGASKKEIRRLFATRQPTDRYEVRSPIDGTIVKTGEIEGSQVHPGDVLFEVSDLRHLWVKAFIYPGEEGHITKGSPVWIRTLHDPDHQVPASIEEVSPMVDPMTRTIPIRIALSNPGQMLEPDLWVSVLIPRPVSGNRTSFIVPAQSVFESRTGQLTVIVRDGSGHFRRIRVVAGATVEGETSVSGDFHQGDQAVTSGLDRIRPLIR
ncbi:MAG: efflux RND transporter periplasmic adaptor subunit [Nitrospirae bacterium]|nr:efflux RND transporter periplasmic adaptor subunit [Nitrospirota bacterium]